MNAPADQTACERGHNLTSPSRLELTVLYFLLGVHMVLGTDAAIPSGWVTFAGASFFAVALWFLIRVVLGAWRYRKFPPLVWRWIEGAIVVAVLVCIHTTSIGVAARVYFSERELMEQVRLVQDLEGKWNTNSGISCGLFTVHGAMGRDDGTVWLETVAGSRLFELENGLYAGVVYCKQGRPAQSGESYYRHLYGPWWLWLQDV